MGCLDGMWRKSSHFYGLCGQAPQFLRLLAVLSPLTGHKENWSRFANRNQNREAAAKVYFLSSMIAVLLLVTIVFKRIWCHKLRNKRFHQISRISGQFIQPERTPKPRLAIGFHIALASLRPITPTQRKLRRHMRNMARCLTAELGGFAKQVVKEHVRTMQLCCPHLKIQTDTEVGHCVWTYPVHRRKPRT